LKRGAAPTRKHNIPQACGYMKLRQLLTLFTNHVDAWGLTLIIVALCLVLHDATSVAHLGLLITLTLTCWLAFAFNDFCDAPFDAQDALKRQRNFFSGNPVPRALIIASGWLIIGALCMMYTGLGGRGLFVLGLSLVALWAYSAPPLRLKSRPVFDLLMHGVFVQTFPYLACMYLINAMWAPIDYALAAVFFLSSVSAQLEQQARDFDVDSKTDTNFATTVGLGTTVWLMRGTSVLLGLVVIMALLGQIVPVKLLPFIVIGLPLIVHRFTRRKGEPRSQRLSMLTLLVALVYLGGIWGAALLRTQ
jgi:4-hydroxybenzoate polyprenyltransferase